jgi:hypothetical protein
MLHKSRLTKIYLLYQNQDLYPIPKGRFISHTYNKICNVYQNLDLYRTPKPILVLVYDINLGIGMLFKSWF